MLLPTRVRHKCDEHLLALTYHKITDYLEHHYCDICERKRDPKSWFYHCTTCDTSAHVKCVLEPECNYLVHCGFYLHKVRAKAPLELNHPFHLNHPLLMQNAPYSS
ncbi:hypothetical protein Goarm_012309, partial [Gossypium armourianum]|nr:hypothetical protein [Gossypium armourianum]